MKMMNKIGPNTLPCGIPLVTGRHSEKVPLITICFLFDKNASIHFKMFPFIPYPSTFFLTISCEASCRKLYRNQDR